MTVFALNAYPTSIRVAASSDRFDSREDALQDADVRNDEAYFEQQAFYAAKTLIESIKDRVLEEVRGVARRARWRFLSFLRVGW